MLKNSIKYGDIFQIGSHILACGDARDAKLVDKVMLAAKVNLIITDVPYGIQYVESKKDISNVKVNKKILNDDITSDSEYSKFTAEWLKTIQPYLTKKNSIYIFNCDKMLLPLVEGIKKVGLTFSQLLIWIKNQPVIGRKDYLPMHELIVYGWYGTHTFRKSKDKSVLFYPKPQKSSFHPTQKPIPLLRKLILNSSNMNDTIYDCFAGSGTTGIACEQTKRKCIMIERDEEYCQVILDRFKTIFNLNHKKL